MKPRRNDSKRFWLPLRRHARLKSTTIIHSLEKLKMSYQNLTHGYNRTSSNHAPLQQTTKNYGKSIVLSKLSANSIKHTTMGGITALYDNSKQNLLGYLQEDKTGKVIATISQTGETITVHDKETLHHLVQRIMPTKTKSTCGYRPSNALKTNGQKNHHSSKRMQFFN